MTKPPQLFHCELRFDYYNIILFLYIRPQQSPIGDIERFLNLMQFVSSWPGYWLRKANLHATLKLPNLVQWSPGMKVATFGGGTTSQRWLGLPKVCRFSMSMPLAIPLTSAIVSKCLDNLFLGCMGSWSLSQGNRIHLGSSERWKSSSWL